MKDDIIIRCAEMRDIKPVFELSNDPVVRAHSIHKEPIPWESHVVWFEKAISNPDIRFFVAETEDGEFVGQVRFNLEKGNWVVSISIKKDFRGKGLTKMILCEAIRQVGGERFVAEIAPDNEASKHLFLSAGFVSDETIAATPGFLAFSRGPICE